MKCYEFVCHIGELSPGDYVVIELRARLWNSTFLEVMTYTALQFHYFFRTSLSGGASAMKEPGHFVVRKFSSQVRSPGVLVPIGPTRSISITALMRM